VQVRGGALANLDPASVFSRLPFCFARNGVKLFLHRSQNADEVDADCADGEISPFVTDRVISDSVIDAICYVLVEYISYECGAVRFENKHMKDNAVDKDFSDFHLKE
jgi:hypothetical protein